MAAPGLNTADLNTALDEVKALYERLAKAGLDPHVIVIAMAEIIAYCLANATISGAGEEKYRAYLRAFESSYRAQLSDLRAKS